MRNSHNITLTNNDSLTEDEETTWSLPGAVVGFISWLFALAMPMLIYGSNTLFFFIYTWPFFLALMPVAVVVGIALHSLMDGKLRYSIRCGSVRTVYRTIPASMMMWRHSKLQTRNLKRETINFLPKLTISMAARRRSKSVRVMNSA